MPTKSFRLHLCIAVRCSVQCAVISMPYSSPHVAPLLCFNPWEMSQKQINVLCSDASQKFKYVQFEYILHHHWSFFFHTVHANKYNPIQYKLIFIIPDSDIRWQLDWYLKLYKCTDTLDFWLSLCLGDKQTKTLNRHTCKEKYTLIQWLIFFWDTAALLCLF